MQEQYEVSIQRHISDKQIKEMRVLWQVIQSFRQDNKKSLKIKPILNLNNQNKAHSNFPKTHNSANTGSLSPKYKHKTYKVRNFPITVEIRS